MKHKLILLSLIFLYITSYPQMATITIQGINNNKAYLFSLEGEKTFLIDSINTSSNDNFVYSFVPSSNHTGFYRFNFNNNKWIDFIYDIEDVQIETDTNNILDKLKVIKSESNKIYYEFIKLNKDFKTKSELLQLILARYPKEDEYYQKTKEKLIQVQEEYLYFVNVTAQVNPNSFIARYIRTAQLPVIDIEIPFDKQLTFLKAFALNNVNFSDDGLIYSDAFTNKSIEYLTNYRNPQLPMALLEKEFQTAVDSILNKAKANEIVYKHIVEYLLDGFKKFGFDNVINYIVTNYVIKDELCLDEKLEIALERRIQQSKNFKIGNTVPNIIVPDSSGSLIELNKINSEKTLIIFYASWCPHCQTLLPQVYGLYKNQKDKKFEVLAVSIDTSRTDWLTFVKDKKLDWLNVFDLKGWEGRAAIDYNIYATPTMFLIDNQLRLISKPSSIEELDRCF
ncbi:MAG: redoxin domain-containing protein [Ignavibacteriales bacterium]|nr:redoxin domain-containing protein [Ignavibacteriales bacterium]